MHHSKMLNIWAFYQYMACPEIIRPVWIPLRTVRVALM